MSSTPPGNECIHSGKSPDGRPLRLHGNLTPPGIARSCPYCLRRNLHSDCSWTEVPLCLYVSSPCRLRTGISKDHVSRWLLVEIVAHASCGWRSPAHTGMCLMNVYSVVKELFERKSSSRYYLSLMLLTYLPAAVVLLGWLNRISRHPSVPCHVSDNDFCALWRSVH